MKVGTFFAGALLTAGLLTGCGGAETEMEAQAGVSAREDALATCFRQVWVDYYSDPSHSKLVGQQVCQCGGSPFIWGIRSSHAVSRLPSELCQ